MADPGTSCAPLHEEMYGEFLGEEYTGENHSVNEIANLISDNQVNIPPRIGEARISLANNEKLRKTFGWKPTVKLDDWISQQ